MNEKNGFLCAFGIFGLSSAAFPCILLISGLVPVSGVLAVYSSPVSLGLLGGMLATDLWYVWKNYSTIGGYLRDRDGQKLDEVQKTVIEFPRRIIALSLLFTLSYFQIVLFFFPEFSSVRMSALMLSFTNATFFGIPLYIFFYQRIEKWATPVPYTSKYVSLKLSARILLVVLFSILAICFFLVISINETVRLHADPATLASAINGKSIPIVLFGFFVGLVNITLIMKGMAQRIRVSNEFSWQLGEGNLSGAAFSIMPRDEFGTLASGLINVREKIGLLIQSVKKNVATAVEAKNKLLGTTEQSRGSVMEVGQDISAVNGKVAALDTRTDAVFRSMGAVGGSIDDLNGQITAQSTRVEESTAAVTEMIAALRSISSVTSKKLETTTHLTDASATGRLRLDETVATIKSVSGSVGEIYSMVSAIQGIAAQTNLLAMNAAIEAAHAGEYGQGFAVVADEIRNLSVSASVNSKQINATIKKIVSMIRDATQAGDATSAAFESVSSEIHGVVASFTEIERGVTELLTGGRHVLDSIEELREISVNVSANSGRIRKETVSVQQDLSQVRALSEQTRIVTAHMAENIRKVTGLSEEMTAASNEISEVTDRISGNLEAFKTE